MFNPRFVVLLLGHAAVTFAVGLGVGFLLFKPSPSPPQPNAEQLTIAAATLVHGLEVQNDYSLNSAPSFLSCLPTKTGGWNCDFRATYIDESSDVWQLTLSAKNIPTIIKRVQHTPAPPAN